MNTSNVQIWQQAAGDTDRNYVVSCLEWNVILNGPGWAGRFPECSDELLESGVSKRKITDLRRFSEDMKIGDIVVLRMGTKNVYAVGTIISDYLYSDLFSDVDGWDLQHVRRVKWDWSSLDNPKEFETYEMKQGDTTQLLDSIDITNWINTIPDKNVYIPELPTEGKLITFSEISDFMFSKGVDLSAINDLANQIQSLVTLAKWYQQNGMKPSENETLAYLTVPLLCALGWSPQKMAIEWNNIDIALFESLPRDNETLITIIEGKRIGSSALKAVNQALGYSQTRSQCKKIIVTDGVRYSIYLKQNETFSSIPIAYLNLTEFRESYPIYKCKGAAEALYQMSKK